MCIKKNIITIISIFLIGMSSVYSQINFTEEEKKWITDHPKIDFGYDANWPPFEMYTNGEYTGISADYIKLIEHYTGIEMKPIPGISWNETITKLRSGEIHVAPLVGIIDDRKDFLEFTKSYVSDPLVIVTRDDFQSLSGLNDLANKKISLPKGYYTLDLIKKDFPSIEIVTSNTIKDCLLEVSTSGTDAFVGGLSVVSYYINSNGFANLKIASQTKYGYTQMGLAVTKDWKIFRDISQKVFDHIPKAKQDSIKNKWVSIRYDYEFTSEKIWRYVYYGLMGFLLFFIGFYIWNSTLRKQIKNREIAESELNKSLALIQQKNSEKEILLKEIHHRVKNNLQIVYSLLNMQTREVVNKDALIILEEGKLRVKAMALVHQVLYESDDLSKVDINDYINSLIKSITRVNHNPNKDIKIIIHANDISLELDKIIPLGLILNELLANSFKHAFKNRETGLIQITLKRENNEYFFEYQDDGVGIENLNVKEYKSLGIRLVNRLSNQLNTQVIFKNDNGFNASFSFNKLEVFDG